MEGSIVWELCRVCNGGVRGHQELGGMWRRWMVPARVFQFNWEGIELGGVRSAWLYLFQNPIMHTVVHTSRQWGQWVQMGQTELLVGDTGGVW